MKTKIKLLLGIILIIIIETLPESKNKISDEDKIPQETINNQLANYYKIPRDTSEILKLFFENGEIMRNNLIRWKPELEEKLQMHVAQDGFCYTSLDTVLISDKDEKIFVFLTFEYDTLNGINECHACAPNYSIGKTITNNKELTIQSFCKNIFTAGAWGKGAEVELLDFNNDKSVLKITSGWTGMGEVNEYVNLFDLDRMTYLLGFQSLHSNELALDDPFEINKGLVKKEVKLITEEGKNGYNDVILNLEETVFDSTQEKLITRFSTKVYRWNEEQEFELCYE